jgi:hypothetical protein
MRLPDLLPLAGACLAASGLLSWLLASWLADVLAGQRRGRR